MFSGFLSRNTKNYLSFVFKSLVDTIEKIERWSDISQRKRPFVELLNGSVVKMLSIREALCSVILVGRVTRGKMFSNTLTIKSSPVVWCLNDKASLYSSQLANIPVCFLWIYGLITDPFRL